MLCRPRPAPAHRKIALLLLIAWLPGLSFGGITPKLLVSRASGPAPLAVHFDASQTAVDDAAVNPTGDLGYKFDFGDPDSGTWIHSGKPKNQQIGGPIAAHVYDQPGTYTVSLEVHSPAGGQVNTSVTITVQSPDTAYPGSSTVCLVMDAAKTVLCPPSSIVRVAPTSWGSFANDTRYMLASGDNFTSLGTATVNCQNCMIMKMGEGPNPKLGKVSYGSKPVFPQRGNFVLSGVSAESLSIGFGEALLVAQSEFNYPPTAPSASAVVLAGDTVAYYYNNPGSIDPAKIMRPRNLVFSENKIDGGGVSSKGVYLIANNLVFMGNEVKNTLGHNVRVPFTRNGFIAHNLLIAGANETKHNLKIHSSGYEETAADYYVDSKTPSTDMVVVSSNRIGGPDGDVNNWQIAASPQSDLFSEGLSRLIFEDNRFVWNPTAPSGQQQLAVTGRYVIERGNAFTNKTDQVGVGENTHGKLVPVEWKGPYLTGLSSVSDWINSSKESPPAPVQLQVQ